MRIKIELSSIRS